MTQIGRVVIGHRLRDRVVIEVHGRRYPDAEDYWDGNWLSASVNLAVGPWKGTSGIGLYAVELTRLRGVIEEIYEHLDGTYIFEPMEHDMTLTFAGDGRGHISLRGQLRDILGATEISFCLAMDQTDLPQIVQEIDRVLEIFPVVGQP
jgi:hypothetical protein